MESKFLATEVNFTVPIVLEVIHKSQSKEPLCDCWNFFAQSLQVPEADIANLRNRINPYVFDVHEIFGEILQIWKEETKAGATSDALKDVLISLGFNDIADGIDEQMNPIPVQYSDAGVIKNVNFYVNEFDNATETPNKRLRRNSDVNAANHSLSTTQNVSGIAPEQIEVDFKQELGHGGMGNVFKGTFGPSKIRVAVKVISNISEGRVEVVTREIEHYKSIKAYPNVVRYFGHTREFKEARYKFCIALELCNMNLQEWIDDKRLDISDLDVIRQITLGLQHLHNLPKRIVHRDLKPENVVLKDEGKEVSVKLTDLGISKSIPNDKSHYTSETGSGSQHWMSPEILQNMLQIEDNVHVTPKSDIFSLGCLFYYVLTGGKRPFKALPTEKSLYRPIIIEKHFNDATFYWNFGDLIRHMISFHANERPSADKVIGSFKEQIQDN